MSTRPGWVLLSEWLALPMWSAAEPLADLKSTLAKFNDHDANSARVEIPQTRQTGEGK